MLKQVMSLIESSMVKAPNGIQPTRLPEVHEGMEMHSNSNGALYQGSNAYMH